MSSQALKHIMDFLENIYRDGRQPALILVLLENTLQLENEFHRIPFHRLRLS